MAYFWVSTDATTGVHTFEDDYGELFQFLEADLEHLHIDLTGIPEATLVRVAPEVGDLTAIAAAYAAAGGIKK